MDRIYVLMSFKLEAENGISYMGETGKTIWLPTLDEAVSFVAAEGPSDSLSEHRWMYLVLEEVEPGPLAGTTVHGWWKASYQDGGFKEWVPLEESPITDSGSYFQFAGIGG